jgi:diaminopimelate decarboxylase
MDHVEALISQYFSSSDKVLHIGGVSVDELSAKYGTPMFVYDSHVLTHKWATLRRTLPAEFAISYSVKANPNPFILGFFLDKGCGLEVASGGEFYQALCAGCPPEKVLFAGPGKTEAELELALAKGIGEIHLESLLEMERVSSISRRLGVRARVAVRVNPSGETQGGALRMGGKPAPFGVDEERLDLVLDRLLPDPFLEFRGIHLFTGTQILDHAILLHQYREGLELARRVAARSRHSLHTVDFGGGLGIPYFPDERELNMDKLQEEMARLMADIKDEPLFAKTQFMVEPGRYLVGDGGVYITRINDIKVSRGKKFLILDGGMHHHLAASGNLGQTLKRNFPLALLNKLTHASEETVDVVGPLCTPLDVLGRGVTLPRAEVGDLIGVFQSGAYARTASPLGFLSHPSPPEVWVAGGRDYLIRRRGTYEDYLQDHCLPQSKCISW